MMIMEVMILPVEEDIMMIMEDMILPVQENMMMIMEDMTLPVQEECPPSYREDYVYPYPEDEFITVKRWQGIAKF